MSPLSQAHRFVEPSVAGRDSTESMSMRPPSVSKTSERLALHHLSTVPIAILLPFSLCQPLQHRSRAAPRHHRSNISPNLTPHSPPHSRHLSPCQPLAHGPSLILTSRPPRFPFSIQCASVTPPFFSGATHPITHVLHFPRSPPCPCPPQIE